MNRTLKWIIAVVFAGGAIVALSFAFIEGRDEIAREREREAPIKIAPRISRNAEGDLIITLDAETQKRIALETAALTADTVRPEVAAYGRVQEDPDASFVVRAPTAGILRAATGRNWPLIGETIPDDTSIGTIEPRLAPIESVDLATRISDARADAEAAEARELAAAFKDGPAVTDLIAYALALEAEAVKLEENALLELDPMPGHGRLDRPVVVTTAHL